VQQKGVRPAASEPAVGEGEWRAELQRQRADGEQPEEADRAVEPVREWRAGAAEQLLAQRIDRDENIG